MDLEDVYPGGRVWELRAAVTTGRVSAERDMIEIRDYDLKLNWLPATRVIQRTCEVGGLDRFFAATRPRKKPIPNYMGHHTGRVRKQEPPLVRIGQGEYERTYP